VHRAAEAGGRDFGSAGRKEMTRQKKMDSFCSVVRSESSDALF
jgi:hypothetical protein